MTKDKPTLDREITDRIDSYSLNTYIGAALGAVPPLLLVLPLAEVYFPESIFTNVPLMATIYISSMGISAVAGGLIASHMNKKYFEKLLEENPEKKYSIKKYYTKEND